MKFQGIVVRLNRGLDWPALWLLKEEWMEEWMKEEWMEPLTPSVRLFP